MQGLDLPLKCDMHNESFGTPTEFNIHLNEKSHTSSGETLCADCLSRGIKERVIVDQTRSQKGSKVSQNCEDCDKKIEKRIIDKLKKEGKLK